MIRCEKNYSTIVQLNATRLRRSFLHKNIRMTGNASGGLLSNSTPQPLPKNLILHPLLGTSSTTNKCAVDYWNTFKYQFLEISMKQLLIGSLVMFFATTASAHGCPGEMRTIDAKLPTATLPAAEIVKALRAEGEKLHKEGKHTESMKALADAKKLLGVWEHKSLTPATWFSFRETNSRHGFLLICVPTTQAKLAQSVFIKVCSNSLATRSCAPSLSIT